MNKRLVLIVVVAAVFFDLTTAEIGVTPTPLFSTPIPSATGPASKMRIEAFIFSGSAIDFCAIWLSITNSINFARYRYDYQNPPVDQSTSINNSPATSQLYNDIDVVDGTYDCNVVVMQAQSWSISGATIQSFSTNNETFDAIGVSNQASGFNVVLRKGGQISPFIGQTFMDRVETRRLSDTQVLVAAPLYDSSDLFVGIITDGTTGTQVGGSPYSFNSVPTSISIATYPDGQWVICAIDDQFRCLFSSDTSGFKTISSVPATPSWAAISFIDCKHIAYVLASSTQYYLNLVNVNAYTANSAGYYSSNTNSFTAIHMATTQKVTAVIASNTSGVYMDTFQWPLLQSSCADLPLPPIPITTPSSSPSGNPPPNTPSTPSSPNSSPNSPQGSPNNSPSSNGTTTNPGSQSPDSGLQQGPTPPGGVDPVGLGVGLAIPLAVLGVGAFLLVFFLRKRNKKRKENKSLTQTNPINDVNDVDSPPPSVQPTDPGVYQNLPSNNTTNKNTYTSLGNVANNDSFTTASAAIELPEIDKRLHIPYKSLVFIKEIGAGSYGKVFLGEWRGAKVAIKVNNQITDVDGFLAEAKLTLGIAPHPNLVQTFGVSLDGPNPCIVLEYCGGGSLDLLLYDEKNKLDAAKQREFAMKIAYGLLHLHNNNIVHRDLAARNILLTNDQQPKISDFGMSRVIQEENSKGHTKTNFGPIRWMAPESLRDRSYSVKSDVWSYGIVVNEILSRKEPHVNEDQLSIAVKIRDQAVTPEIPSNADPALVEVIHKCLKADAKDRPTMEELCQFLRAKID